MDYKGINLFEGNCMYYMASMPNKCFELAIVDPPWGINASAKKQYHANALTVYIPKQWDNEKPSAEYFARLWQVSVNQIIWGANYFVDHLPPAKNWIVWDKKQPQGLTFSMHELAYYSGAGQAMIYRGTHGGNCVSNNIEKAQKNIRICPTQKPVALYEWLLNNYAKQGDKILDTHAGSFSSAIACHNLGFDYVGIELDPDYFEAGKKRVEMHQRQGRLF